jgi:hypothetical protein
VSAFTIVLRTDTVSTLRLTFLFVQRLKPISGSVCVCVSVQCPQQSLAICVQGAFNVMNMNHNPMFTATDSVLASPLNNSVYNTAEEPSVQVEARITLPDAGNLFSPMPEVVASAPEHIVLKFQDQPRYDGNLHLPYLTSTCYTHMY